MTTRTRGWHGPQGRGAKAALRKVKHDEALRRNMLTPPAQRSTKHLWKSVTA
jgi:hypothetical protein